jgi:hypothetical protein
MYSSRVTSLRSMLAPRIVVCQPSGGLRQASNVARSATPMDEPERLRVEHGVAIKSILWGQFRSPHLPSVAALYICITVERTCWVPKRT